MVEVMDYLTCLSPHSVKIGERGEPNMEIPGAATLIIGDTRLQRVPDQRVG
jgi:hypothetical protein